MSNWWVCSTRVDLQEFWVIWRVKYDEGIVSAEGFAKIDFGRSEDDFYAVREESPFKDQ